MFNQKRKKLKLVSALVLPICVFIIALSCFVGVSTPADVFEVADAATTVESYYAGLNENLRGTAFRTELASLITSTHKYNPTYGGLANIFDESDADPNTSGNILWFYTGTSVKFTGSWNTTNREHVWPKNAGSAFPEKDEAGSDAHHLRPTNAQLNSTRGNNSFGEVATTSSNIVKENGTTNYKNPCYQSNSVFYPGVGYRGATARILMYVQTRWGDKYNLTFVLGKGNNKTIGDIETLMKWHLEEPPTEAEKKRNEVVYGVQGNRNPFIDHPEYAEMIYCNDGKSYNDELQVVAKKYGSYLDEDEYKDVEIKEEENNNTGNNTGNSGTLPTITASEFATLVNAVVSAQDTNAKYNAIKSAADGYKRLDTEGKLAAASDYATLQQEITAYNNLATEVNTEATKATEQAIMMFLSTFPILSVAAYFLLKP